MRTCPHRGYPIPNDAPICPYHGYCRATKWGVPRNRFDLIDASLLEKVEDACGEMFFEYRQKVKSPFYLWMQNAMDFNHLEFIHTQFQGVFKEGAEPYDIGFSFDEKLSCHYLEVAQKEIDFFENFAPISHYFFHLSVFPNISLTSFLEIVYSIETVTEIDSMTSLVDTKFFVRKGYTLPKAVLDSMKRANALILEEDKAVCEKWWESSAYKVPKRWFRHEDRIRSYCKLLEKNGIPK